MAGYTIILLAVTIVGALAYLLHIAQEKGVEKFHQENIKNLQERYPEVFRDHTEYQFFTTGHPYVWVSVGYQEILTRLKNCCAGVRGFPQSPVYAIRVNQEMKHVYVAPGYPRFNFGTLLHYREWLGSNQDVAKRIPAYKNRQT
mgnify:CR=1 FL=1